MMAQLIFLQKFILLSSHPFYIARYSRFTGLQRIGYGSRLCATKVKPLVQVRRVSKTTKVCDNDPRRRHFEDLVLTIDKLHTAKLSNDSCANKISDSRFIRTDAPPSTHCPEKVPSSGESYSRTDAAEKHRYARDQPNMWTSSIESFSEQMLQFRPAEELKDGGLKTIVQKTASSSKGATNANPAAVFNSGIKNDEALQNRALNDVSSTTPVSKKRRKASSTRSLEHTVASKTGVKLKPNSSTERKNNYAAVIDYEQPEVTGLLDITGEMQDEMFKDGSFVSTSDATFESVDEDADFSYDTDLSKKIETGLTIAERKTDEKVKTKRARLKTLPVWTKEDLGDPDRLKDVLDRVSGILKEDKKLVVQRAKEAENQAKEAAFYNQVSTFVDLCVNTNMLNYAQSLLTTCYLRGKNREKLTRGLRPVRDLAIYNKLMRSWAKQGNLEAIRKLFLQLQGLELNPNFESLAICLECLGRQDPFSVDVTSHVIDDIKIACFHLEDIFIACNFVEEEKGFILKAIRKIVPEFNPKTRALSPGYSSSLLQHLNEDKEFVSNPFHGVLDARQLVEKFDEQMKVETSDAIHVESILPNPPLTAAAIAARERLSVEKEKWQAALKHGFLTSRQYLQSNSNSEIGTSLLPYLKLWKADVYVGLMMQEVEILGQDMALYSPSCTALHHFLGQKIFRKYVIQSRIRNKYIDEIKSLYLEYGKKFDEEKLCQNHRLIWTELMSEMKKDNVMTEIERWPSTVTKSLGKFLYEIIMSEVKVVMSDPKDKLRMTSKNISEEKGQQAEKSNTRTKNEMPAFFTIYRLRNGVPSEEILPHPFLVRNFSDAQLTHLTFDPSVMPSLVPPIPWFAHNCGGNLLNTTDLIRNPWFTQNQHQLVKQLPHHSLFPTFDGLNAISACPWKINTRVLDLIVEVFNKGGDSKLGLPEKVSADFTRVTPQMSSEERLKVLRENRLAAKERNEIDSQWFTELYRLSIARKCRNKVFWFPHNMDFRGRIYPTPPHFNHLGSDVVRSILVFGKGKALGPNGLDWLKIHIINLTGFKKRRPNRERLEYANEVMSDILDSADNPLTGGLWWQKSDKPWQTLACCMEIANAIRSPDREKFISHIPVHQDGSCNGLQHYAALGRDEAGATSVNLNSFDSPKDVYSDVVELVERSRTSSSDGGLEIAKSLDGFVRRKVIKQTIMTTVYGVTQYGARSQIGGQLRHIEEFPQHLVFPAMAYLTEKTFQSLQQMFTSTKEIQDWFVLCSDIISRIRQFPVEWVTPLGWPVIQPYFKVNRISDKKSGGGAMLKKPNAMKQKNAFPPNFIHSLDSAHMMLTAIHCLRKGILFASVHDCFWTHASDVPAMNKICREQFVALHSEPILEDLAKSLITKFGFSDNSFLSDEEEKKQAKEFVNYVLTNVPDRGWNRTKI